MKNLFLLLCVLMIAISLSASLGHVVALEEIPAAYEFSGENAVLVINNTVYLVYTTVTDSSNTVVFAYSTPCGDFTYHYVDTEDALYGAISGSPSLAIYNQTMYLMFKQGNANHRLYSTDQGNTWMRENTPNPFSAGSDPLPMQIADANGLKSFTVYSDPMGSDLYLFTDIAETMNETPSYFWGPDEIDGSVRVNTNLWLKQAGGGNNGGWPLFHAPVITSGSIESFSGTIPYESVFLGGYVENAPPLNPDVEFMRTSITENLISIGAEDEENTIYMLDATGTSANLLKASITERMDFADVYASYPPPVGDVLYQNIFTVRDTVWTVLPTQEISNGLRFYSPLWIKGSFQGNVVIYSHKDIYLIGDILLANTIAGTSPSNPDSPNNSDRVSLISEGQIIIKYGYKDPISGVRIHPNCDADGEGITIYADLIAPQLNAPNPRKDGIFTFEYQHPHPSTPIQSIYGVSYDWIDLHRYPFPQTATQPWLSNLDYPWYNPLWPEGHPFRERGTVNLWGSVLQKRNGFMHRPYLDVEHNSQGQWDIDFDYCGGSSALPYVDPVTGITLHSANYPGASGAGIGYKKNYSYDDRQVPPSVKNQVFGLGIRIVDSSAPNAGVFQKLYPRNEAITSKSIDHMGDRFLYHLNNGLYDQNSPLPQVVPNGYQIMQAKLLPGNSTLQIWKGVQNGILHHAVKRINHSNGDVNTLHEDNYERNMYSLNRLNDSYLFAILNPEGDIELKGWNSAGELNWNHIWQTNQEIFSFPELYDRKSQITIQTGVGDSLYAVLWFQSTNEDEKYLFLGKGLAQPVSVSDETNVPLALSVNCYPNPFAEKLSLSIQTNKSTPLDIAIYNLKGQKLKTWHQHKADPNGTLSWDGKDLSGKDVANGIYFIKINAGKQNLVQKVLKLQ